MILTSAPKMPLTSSVPMAATSSSESTYSISGILGITKCTKHKEGNLNVSVIREFVGIVVLWNLVHLKGQRVKSNCYTSTEQANALKE